MTRKHILIFLIALAAFSVVLIAILVANTPSSQAALQGGGDPNLVPQVPTGWSGPVVPTFITGTNTTDSLYAGLGAVTYFDWAILNDSDTPITVPTTTCLSVDGIQINSWNVPTYAPNSFQTIEDFAHALSEPGIHTVTLEADCTNLIAESDETDNTWTGEFTWNPYIGVIIADEHGFDKCNIATTDQMDIWRNESQYFYSNIYIGGISRACPNTGLTSEWIRHVVERGWNLIPTWVGPQAPCSNYTNRFSWNPGAAREQGRREADAAYQAAQNLGLIPPGSSTILYYDLEAFPNQKFCRQAAGQFLSGWTARLHELGQLSGIYGAGCGSYPVDWPALTAPPDAVWLAHWIFNVYTPSATVWDVACVPNTLWDNFERIRQYAGGHDETWGNVTLNIDSNIALGPVVGINPSLQSGRQDTPTPIRDFQLIAPDQGWILQSGNLLWKNPGDNPWTDLTPLDQTVLAAFFLDPDTGWIASPAQAEDGALALDISSTPDRGQTWHPAGTLPASFSDGTGGIWLHFLDEQTGWAAIQLPSSSNFSIGALFHTTNGGQTWEELSLPIGAPVYFVDTQTGWTAGGPAGDELYVTHDGGETWSELDLASRPALYALPTFVDGTGVMQGIMQGIMPVTLPGDDSRVAFFVSYDNGQTWQSAGEIPIPTAHSLDTSLPVSIVDADTWLIANPETGALYTKRDGTKTTTPLAAAPLQIQFVTPDAGWALTFSADCTGAKGTLDFQCVVQNELWKTENGGESWKIITPQ